MPAAPSKAPEVNPIPLGEGGKKEVYLAQDTLLDREVAFALVKTVWRISG